MLDCVVEDLQATGQSETEGLFEVNNEQTTQATALRQHSAPP